MLGLNVFIGIRRDIKGSFVDALFILVIGFRDLVSWLLFHADVFNLFVIPSIGALNFTNTNVHFVKSTNN